MNLKTLLFFVLVAFAWSTEAGLYIWTDSFTGPFNSNASWVNGSVPTKNDEVLITSGTVEITTLITVKQMTVQSSGNVSVSAGGFLNTTVNLDNELYLNGVSRVNYIVASSSSKIYIVGQNNTISSLSMSASDMFLLNSSVTIAQLTLSGSVQISEYDTSNATSVVVVTNSLDIDGSSTLKSVVLHLTASSKSYARASSIIYLENCAIINDGAFQLEGDVRAYSGLLNSFSNSGSGTITSNYTDVRQFSYSSSGVWAIFQNYGVMDGRYSFTSWSVINQGQWTGLLSGSSYYSSDNVMWNVSANVNSRYDVEFTPSSDAYMHVTFNPGNYGQVSIKAMYINFYANYVTISSLIQSLSYLSDYWGITGSHNTIEVLELKYGLYRFDVPTTVNTVNVTWSNAGLSLNNVNITVNNIYTDSSSTVDGSGVLSVINGTKLDGSIVFTNVSLYLLRSSTNYWTQTQTFSGNTLWNDGYLTTNDNIELVSSTIINTGLFEPYGGSVRIVNGLGGTDSYFYDSGYIRMNYVELDLTDSGIHYIQCSTGVLVMIPYNYYYYYPQIQLSTYNLQGKILISYDNTTQANDDLTYLSSGRTPVSINNDSATSISGKPTVTVNYAPPGSCTTWTPSLVVAASDSSECKISTKPYDSKSLPCVTLSSGTAYPYNPFPPQTPSTPVTPPTTTPSTPVTPPSTTPTTPTPTTPTTPTPTTPTTPTPTTPTTPTPTPETPLPTSPSSLPSIINCSLLNSYFKQINNNSYTCLNITFGNPTTTFSNVLIELSTDINTNSSVVIDVLLQYLNNQTVGGTWNVSVKLNQTVMSDVVMYHAGSMIDATANYTISVTATTSTPTATATSTTTPTPTTNHTPSSAGRVVPYVMLAFIWMCLCHFL